MTQATHVSGTIKPLVWEDADEGMCTKWRAAALGGHYELVIFDKDLGFAVNFSWGRPLSYWFIQGDPDEWGPTGPKMFPTLEAAKSAAHADCEARIAAQIQTDDHAEVSVAEAARVLLDKMGDDWGRAVNAMTPILWDDLDKTDWNTVSEMRDAFIAALRALTEAGQ